MGRTQETRLAYDKAIQRSIKRHAKHSPPISAMVDLVIKDTYPYFHDHILSYRPSYIRLFKKKVKH